jgi:lantibiotic biosynthesis protein
MPTANEVLLNRASRQPQPAARPTTAVQYQHGGFFLLRTPLLPATTLLRLLPDTTAPAAESNGGSPCGSNITRERLRELVTRPEVREALYVATPSLERSLLLWLDKPDSEQGAKVERALLRYLTRMAFRPTPFGLFSGHSLGTVGRSTSLVLPPLADYRRHTMVDLGLVEEALAQLRSNRELRSHLKYRPNPTVFECGERARFTQTHRRKTVVLHEEIAVDMSPHLQCLLREASHGATPPELATSLVSFDPEVALEDAVDFVNQAIDSQLLLGDLTVPITGDDPVRDAVSPAAAAPEAGSVVNALLRAQAQADELDRAVPGGNAIGSYEAIKQVLNDVGVPLSDGQLLHVVLRKPATGLTLHTRVLDDALHAQDLLRSFASGVDSDLADFVTRFRERYDEQEVPLLEVLDDEIGIGFLPPALGVLTPLLDGITMEGPGANEKRALEPRDAYLLRRLTDVLTSGSSELALTPEDIRALQRPDAPPLPDSWSLVGVLAARSAAAVDAGDYRLLLRPVFGPSGVKYLARFCHGDPELLARTRELAEAEAALRSDAVIAELIYLPQARAGNVLAHPWLRHYEIPVNGRTGVPQERQIQLSDLRVRLDGQRIRVRSVRLNRDVIPFVSSAYQHRQVRNSAVYQFLARLAGQGTAQSAGWLWGALQASPRLPRVRWGNVVLDLARWRLSQQSLGPLAKASAQGWPAALSRLRSECGLPRWVGLREADNILPFNLDNTLSAEMFWRMIRVRKDVDLVEIWPPHDELCVEGPEGPFRQELVFPFLRRPGISPNVRAGAAAPGPRLVARGAASSPAAGPPRTLRPGSECLFLSVYGGYLNLDRFLGEGLRDLLAQLPPGAVKRWFFIRYADPEWHLRLRFFGDPDALYRILLSRFHDTFQKAHDDRLLRGYRIETYSREVERYGGPHGIELTEDFFHLDSEFTVRLIQAHLSANRLRVRTQLAFASVDRLVAMFGVTPAEREVKFGDWHRALVANFASEGLTHQLGRQYRQWRKVIEAAVVGPPTPELEAGVAILDQRDARMAPLAREIASRWRAGTFVGPEDHYYWSLCHMHLSRLLVAMPRYQETILYDGLRRFHASRRARADGAAASPGAQAAYDVAQNGD